MTLSLPSIDCLVVRCPNWVGDIVMATPTFACLRRNFPEARIIACIRPYARGIIEDSPWFDEILDIQDRSVAGMRDTVRQLRQRRPDAGILLTNTTHSYLTFRLAGISRIYGYRRNLRKHFLSGGPDPVREGGTIKPLPMQQYYLEICRYLGLQLPENPRPQLYIPEALKQQGAKLMYRYGISDSDTVVGINPGASFGSSKCWPPEYFARLAELLQESFHCKLLLLVGPGEASIAERIVSESKAELINTASDRVDLALLKPLVQRCSLLITNDTGPRHYGVAFDVPTVVVMGPTNAAFTATNLELTRVLQRDLPCVPCHKKTCPLGHHACMQEILPDSVLAAARSLVGTLS
ncbi:MAG: lipopolysaccharide heptosyltransferase II [Gammaproteobacteria bacterium]|nr:lipopolysaccharide heptosyltransferase II [Pseudomonadales bacterium]MCP5345743.1 lipopolysaccharide heptosyltransferase II [Pseudomonadales bacterium]